MPVDCLSGGSTAIYYRAMPGLNRKPDVERRVEALRRAAVRHKGVEVGVACEGTPVESRTFKVRGKAFLFLRPGKALLKLQKSQGEASELAAANPGCCKLGSGGWTTVDLGGSKAVTVKRLEGWIAESYELFAAGTPGKNK
ncbi:MAG: MmcQ/YjbR family DNA-binding protein [Myxococcaceae bacterium]